MGKIYVVGTGPGSKDYITPAAEKAVKDADILMGGKKALSLFSNEKPKKTIGSDVDKAINYIAQNRNQNIAVLTSGDPGFYSILALISKNFPKEDIEAIPGISSIQLCFAKLKEHWHDAKFISLHGRGMENISFPEEGKFVILTDKSSTPDKVARHLLKRGLEGNAMVCDSLCQPSEAVLELNLEEITGADFSGNCVMVVKPLQTKKWEYRTPGIPDNLFKKGKSPMTKEEIRAITLSKARIKKDGTVYDIGAGTGSISIEAALLANEGRVFSIEKNPDRCRTVRENIQEFKVPNVEVIEGEAPEVMESLPIATRIIIGGSGGKIREILKSCAVKLDKEGIIVINAIKSETISEATAVLKELDFDFDITQVSIRRVKDQKTEDINPVSIINTRR
jgi:precorrin-6Y C5,15-methyltransferase (decarboxylating)